MMIHFMKEMADRYGWDHILYMNFEDERLLTMEASDLNTVLEVHAEMTSCERPICFFDEIQNVPGWEKFARRLADAKYQVYITGSNARMLSSEIATTLGGRYIVKMVYPYSFPEYLGANGEKKQKTRSTRERSAMAKWKASYFKQGGFPALVQSPDPTALLSTMYQNIYLGDIAARNGLQNPALLRLLMRTLAERVKDSVSFRRLAGLLTSASGRTTASTVIKYIEHAKESYLIFSLSNMIGSLEERKGNQKYYFIDNGILSLLTGSKAALHENMVAVQLFRKYYSAAEMEQDHIYYYKKNGEVDFFITDTRTAVQACYTMYPEDAEQKSAVEREVNGLIKLRDALQDKDPVRRMVIVTYEKEQLPDPWKDTGIEMMGLSELLLENDL